MYSLLLGMSLKKFTQPCLLPSNVNQPFFFFFLNSVLIFIIPTVSIINHCLLYKFTPKKVLFI